MDRISTSTETKRTYRRAYIGRGIKSSKSGRTLMKRHDPGRYSCVRQPTAETAAAAAVQRTSLAPRVINNRYFAEGQPRRLPPGCLVSELWSKNRVLTLTKLKKMFVFRDCLTAYCRI